MRLAQLPKRLDVVVELLSRRSLTRTSVGARIGDLVGGVDRSDAAVAGYPVAVLRLSALVGFDPLVLGHLRDQMTDFRAEPAPDLVVVRGRVLDHVVEKGGGDHLIGEPALVKERGHRDRVVDVGVPAPARSVVRGSGECKCADQKRRGARKPRRFERLTPHANARH